MLDSLQGRQTEAGISEGKIRMVGAGMQMGRVEGMCGKGTDGMVGTGTEGGTVVGMTAMTAIIKLNCGTFEAAVAAELKLWCEV